MQSLTGGGVSYLRSFVAKFLVRSVLFPWALSRELRRCALLLFTGFFRVLVHWGTLRALLIRGFLRVCFRGVFPAFFEGFFPFFVIALTIFFIGALFSLELSPCVFHRGIFHAYSHKDDTECFSPVSFLCAPSYELNPCDLMEVMFPCTLCLGLLPCALSRGTFRCAPYVGFPPGVAFFHRVFFSAFFFKASCTRLFVEAFLCTLSQEFFSCAFLEMLFSCALSHLLFPWALSSGLPRCLLPQGLLPCSLWP